MLSRAPTSTGRRLTPLVRRRLQNQGHDKIKNRWMIQNVGRVLGSIEHEGIEPCGEQVTSASGFDFLCSYSWKEKVEDVQHKGPGPPQIYVPGEAPALILHELPYVVKRRTRTQHYRDANIARMPRYPFEPMFQSLSVMNPGARFDQVDIVINRNSLCNLLRFTKRTCQKSFRLDLAMVHNTLVVTPVWEKITESKRHKLNYGREFEDLFLRRRPDMQDSSTHHRAIRYNLGPLSCAVLSETDGALHNFDELSASSSHKDWTFLSKPKTLPDHLLSKEGQPRTDYETSLFRSVNPEHLEIPRPKHYPHSMVVPRGRGTPSVAAAELVMTKGPSKKMIQLWLGRTPYCVRGTHVGANFTRMDVVYHGTSFRAFEIRNQDFLQQLVSLIRQLKRFAINTDNQGCTVLYDKTIRPLALRVFDHERTPLPPLPEDLRRHFWTEVEAKQKR